MRRPFAAGVLLALALTSAACAGTEEPTEEPSTTAVNEVGHIHGLGTDPSDDSLYVATHFGLFRVQDGVARRIGSRYRDTMGFTVLGPRHFLASGHPDLMEDLPPHLGLMESTDAGKTWTTRALKGRADFHSIDASGDIVHAYDSQSGSVMTSTDLRAFRSVAKVDALDLAVDPSNPHRVLATTARGVISLDSSVRKQEAVRSPVFAYIDWPESDILVGLTPQGELHVSSDSGMTWEKRGTLPGQPAALEVAEGAWFAATTDQVYRSTDSGISWDIVETSVS